MSFVHLHVHTQFSIADATTRTAAMVKYAQTHGSPAIAMTDHDNLYGAIEFTNACKQGNIKPIYGCCLGIASRPVGEHVRRVHHLTLLAKDHEGWQNLIFLISKANLTAPAGGHVRISHELLKAHSGGLIGLSGDLSGEIANALLRGERLEAAKHALRYKETFAPGDFYIEVQQGGLQEHETLLPQLIELAAECDIPCVATNDVHYDKPDQARAHEVLMCIGLGVQARSEDEALPTDELDLASPQEMRRRFAGHEELCDRTLEIAQRCNVKLQLGTPMLPRFPAPDGMTEQIYFSLLAREGLDRRFGELRKKNIEFDEDVYVNRLEWEIGIIQKMDFPGYFLIVQDFINWAKEQDIAVGPGRGSGAGSIVAWSLRITDLDPIPYKLLFERFLNPERVSMPDFDVDFCVDRRGEVIKYVSEKYGQERVGQIATFGTLKAKGALRDTGRALGVPLSEVDALARLVPAEAKNLAEALEKEPRLRERFEQDPEVARLINTSSLLEGALRNVGMHAAGVVIGRGPLWAHVPVGRGLNGENVTQFDKDDVEKAGLVKFDFLGLKNLTMIQHCVRLINEQKQEGEPPLDISLIALDEPRAFAVAARGDTAGIFQCESSGFTAMLMGLQPTVFEDFIASGALYRPGPLGMGMHTRYIERKHGREPVEYPHPDLEPVLKETYGVIVYQEQVMQAAQVLAGFTLGQADNLRKAMGKKNAEDMEKWGQVFRTGAVERGVDATVAADVFELMAKFAEYGFNKSHSAAYGLITYQTAYLKALYPTEFYAALLTSDQDDTDKIVHYIQHARQTGQQVLPPDINESGLSFSVVGGRIRFGLGAIKGLGEQAIENIVAARLAGGPFRSLFDLCRRMDTQKVNRKALEVLVKSGACDGLGQPRDVVFQSIDRAVNHAQQAEKQKNARQVNMLDLMVNKVEPTPEQEPYDLSGEKWNQRKMLGFEKEVLGFYVSGHPLDIYRGDMQRLRARTLASFRDPAEAIALAAKGYQRQRPSAMIVAVVVAHREKLSQKGNRMAFTTLEDLSGQMEVMTFAKALENVSALLQTDEPLLIKVSLGVDQQDDQKLRLTIEEASPLGQKVLGGARTLEITLSERQCDALTLRNLRQLLQSNPGEVNVRLMVDVPLVGVAHITPSASYRVTLSDDLLDRIQVLLGPGQTSWR